MIWLSKDFEAIKLELGDLGTVLQWTVGDKTYYLADPKTVEWLFWEARFRLLGVPQDAKLGLSTTWRSNWEKACELAAFLRFYNPKIMGTQPVPAPVHVVHQACAVPLVTGIEIFCARSISSPMSYTVP